MTNHATFQVYIYSQLNLQWGKWDISVQYDKEQKKNRNDEDCCIFAPHTVGTIIGYNCLRNEKGTALLCLQLFFVFCRKFNWKPKNPTPWSFTVYTLTTKMLFKTIPNTKSHPITPDAVSVGACVWKGESWPELSGAVRWLITALFKARKSVGKLRMCAGL